jgi:hypothetical protein
MVANRANPRKSPEVDARYQPDDQRPQMIDTAMSHIGFRCVIR